MKDSEENFEQHIIPTTSPRATRDGQATPPSSSSDGDETPPRRTRKFQDIYDETEEVLVISNLTLLCLLAETEPTNFKEAINDAKWRKGMDEEMKSIKKNDTWELTTLPKGEKAIGVKWVYKVKKNDQGKVEKYKARLVAKGYNQRHGVNYDEVFTPVARLETIRLFISLTAQNGWKIHQMNAKSTFLNGVLEENMYIDNHWDTSSKGKKKKC